MTPIEAFNKRYDPLRFDQAASEVTDAWMAAWTISSAITEGIMADMMLKDEALLRRALDVLENHTAIKHPQQIYYRDSAIAAIKERLG